MTGDEAVQWIRNQCEIHGDNFDTRYAVGGAVEVRVNDRLVFGFNGAFAQEFDGLHIARVYEAARRYPAPEANPNDHPWHNELPPAPQWRQNEPPALPDADDGRFAFEGVWHNDDEYARQVLPEPEIDPNARVFFVDNGEGNEDVRGASELKFVKHREGNVAQVWSHSWDAITGSTLEIGNTVPMTANYQVDQYGHIIGSRPLTVVPCKSKLHFIPIGTEFCAGCCWNCQTGDAPFCASCRKTMRAEEKEDESVRSFASEHFPSLVAFLD